MESDLSFGEAQKYLGDIMLNIYPKKLFANRFGFCYSAPLKCICPDMIILDYFGNNFIGFFWIFLFSLIRFVFGFLGFYQYQVAFNRFYRLSYISLSATEFFWILLDLSHYIGCYWISLERIGTM